MRIQGQWSSEVLVRKIRLDSIKFSPAKWDLGSEGSPHAFVLLCSRAKWERGFQGRLRTLPTTKIVGVINSHEQSGGNQTYRGTPSKPKGIKHSLTEQGKGKSKQRAEELIVRKSQCDIDNNKTVRNDSRMMRRPRWQRTQMSPLGRVQSGG